MTSRRGKLVEEGARQLLQVNGYTVTVIPPGYNKGYPPAHLVAERTSEDKRFIRIRKISHLSPTIETVVMKCGNDLVQFRKHLSRHPEEAGLHCEIWIYTLGKGFRCFEVLIDSIREVPKFSLVRPDVRKIIGAA